MSDEEKIEMVLEWAEDHPNFDTTFIESLQEALQQYDELTPAQSRGLDNIIYRFRIQEK